MVLKSVSVNPASKKDLLLPGETALFLDVDVTARDGRKYTAMPGIAIDNSNIRQISDTVVAQSLVLQFNKVIDQEKGVLQIGVKESGAITDLITLKVYEFPMINILWLGVIVMVVGFVMSIIQRYKTLKNKLTIS
jgi:cytochrome c-type biogenesis protein CcmF